MYFDTHAHYDDRAFDEDRNELISSLKENGIRYVIIPGCDLESTEKAELIAKNNDFIYFAAGIHPENLQGLSENYISWLDEITEHEKCVAVGEIGLDYYWDVSNKEKQKEVFISQLCLAQRKKLPVIIHDREAHGDSMDIIRNFNDIRGVFHCFSGSVEMAEELLKRGWYLGFDGPITYKNAKKALEVLELCPMDRLLLETDSPYLSPVPMRGKRNDSRNLVYIAEKIAQIKQCSTEEICRAALNNGIELFGLHNINQPQEA